MGARLVTFDVTWLTYATFMVIGYYILLLLVAALMDLRPGKGRHAGPIGAGRNGDPVVVLVIPARNEEAVIATTLASLARLTYRHRLVIVMNDGSTDATSAIVRGVASDDVLLVERTREQAGKGKGDVLNHAFRIVVDLVAQGDSRLRGRGLDDVLIGVMDADGQLDAHALNRVVPYFHDQAVGAVQLGVRIANARDNVLTRMQDIEFVGFSGLVQNARNAFGSVGLGGNGQFVRLSALVGLGRAPWTDCLSEDLDLSLSLVRAGHQVRFCGSTFVAQQGLTRIRPLLRQRARWVQGHYQCWRHVHGLFAARKVPLRTKLDLGLYLVLISFVLVITAGLVLSLVSLTGAVVLVNHFWAGVPEGLGKNVALVLTSCGPSLGFVLTYQRRSPNPLRIWELPAFSAAFCLYGYHWVVSQIWALGRMTLRRSGWAKTPRLPMAAHHAVGTGAGS